MACGGVEGVGDELGAHVVGDRPPRQAAGVAVDHGGQVQVRAVGQRQVGDVPDVPAVRRRGGEVPLEQVGDLLVRALGDRGADPAPALVAADGVLAHHPGDPLVVDPLSSENAVVEVGGHPRRARRCCPGRGSCGSARRARASAAARAALAGAPACQA